MPRAAKDLFRRQLAMKNQTIMKKQDKKKKKQGHYFAPFIIIYY